jgi:hypothetical protein
LFEELRPLEEPPELPERLPDDPPELPLERLRLEPNFCAMTTRPDSVP